MWNPWSKFSRALIDKRITKIIPPPLNEEYIQDKNMQTDNNEKGSGIEKIFEENFFPLNMFSLVTKKT